MIPNNGFSSLTCQVLSSKEDIESILQRITLFARLSLYEDASIIPII